MKKVLLVLVGLILILGVVGALVWFKIVKIPGFDPAKLMGKGKALYGQDATKDKDKVKANEKPKPKVVVAAKPKPAPVSLSLKVDPVKGAQRIADLWATLEPTKLTPIVEQYKDEELVPILLKMDDDKCAALLAALRPDRAANLSRLMQKLASVVEPEVKP